MLRAFHQSLVDDYIDFATVAQSFSRAPLSISHGSPSQPQYLPLSVTNKVLRSLDLSDRTERYFLNNQLLNHMNLINDNLIEDGVHFSTPYPFRFDSTHPSLTQNFALEEQPSELGAYYAASNYASAQREENRERVTQKPTPAPLR